jgi:hypothetical protein
VTAFTVNPEKLAQLDQIEIAHGSHSSFEAGACSMEIVAWLADLGHTDAPSCASPVLTRYTIRLNDRWSTQQRQALKPFLPRMVGTAGDGKDGLREQIAGQYVVGLLVPWLRLAGLDEEADKVASSAGDLPALRRALWAAREAAWKVRVKQRRALVEKVRQHLAENPLAAADAAADAVAAAAADAAAAAAAAAVAAAAAAAAADAAADAVAAAVAVAAADAAADAAAVAAADAVADGGDYWSQYEAAYAAARKHYETNPLPIAQEVADLAASQQGAALELLEKMIDPVVAS